MDHNLVSVRYLVDDVQAAVAFYTTHLGVHGEDENRFQPALTPSDTQRNSTIVQR